ncbi:MAG: Gfo/Idh/MocA family oxidoreductase [Planctomycetales bacterium]|nr:Gfo/Idh/MocA family oxidoreductase [Planctomycetales bacterium]
MASIRCIGLLFVAVMVVAALARGDEGAPDAPLRLGLAGLTHAHVHGALDQARAGRIEITGVAEPNQELAQRLFEQYGLDDALLFPSLDAMLDATQPEAVAAYNSIDQHLAVVEACAPRGIPVMVEKPLAISGADARRMAELARRHKILLLTNYETTWYASNQALYDLAVVRGELGPLRKIVMHAGHPGPIEIGCNEEFVEWLTDPARNGGGAVVDFGCYGANLATWLMRGERPRTVTAVLQQIKPDRYPHVDDEATIVLTYPAAQAILQASWNWPANRKDLHVYGAAGLAQAHDGAHLTVRRRESEAPQLQTLPPRQPPEDGPFAYLRAAVRGEIDPAGSLSSLENNLVVVEILDAARESAATGATISLPQRGE